MCNHWRVLVLVFGTGVKITVIFIVCFLFYISMRGCMLRKCVPVFITVIYINNIIRSQEKHKCSIIFSSKL